VSKTFKIMLILVVCVPFGGLGLLGMVFYLRDHERASLVITLVGIGITVLTTYILVRRRTESAAVLRKRHGSPKARASIAAFGIAGAILFPVEIYMPLQSDFDQRAQFLALTTLCVAAVTWLAARSEAVVIYEDEADLIRCAATPLLGAALVILLSVGSIFFRSIWNDAMLRAMAILLEVTFIASLAWSIYKSTRCNRNLFVGIVIGFIRVFLPLALSVFAVLLAAGIGGRKENASDKENASATLLLALVAILIYAAVRAYFRSLINGDDVGPYEESTEADAIII
jgi:hypothetical protein